MMEEVARQHWESWFDLSVPALNDMTPFLHRQLEFEKTHSVQDRTTSGPLVNSPYEASTCCML
jgi:hypothetical protein